MRVIEHLLKAVRDAAVFNPEVQVAPACILWPDRDRQWEAVIPRLQNEMPELLVLGDYAPEKEIGPAIWLRCVIARKIDNVALPENVTPILYLPGVGRQDLRAVENCEENRKPLVELQYRGAFWSQINGKDWTILAFLKSDQGGLGLDVAQDNATLSAMQLSLSRLLDEDIELLRGKRLDKDYFNTLLAGGDPVRDLLQWLDQGNAFRDARGGNEWRAFVEVCKSQFAFDPANDGILTGADKLASHEGPWKPVWERFCEAPKRYPNIPNLIRGCPMPEPELLSDIETHGGWPQWNEMREDTLRQSLSNLGDFPAHEARKRIADLVKQHCARKELVWAELGEAPLACAVEYLGVLAEITSDALSAGTMSDLATAYSNSGWKADDAVLRILACIDRQEDLEAVITAIRSIYLPWAEESARYLQKIWLDKPPTKNAYPGIANANCVLFVDGLRFDCARRLAAMIEECGLHVTDRSEWATLPSVTGTAKPAVAPLSSRFCEAKEAEPQFFGIMTSYQFEKALTDSG